MEAIIQQKALEQFVSTPIASIIQPKPENIDISTIDVTRMLYTYTCVTNDGNYFIRYGGFATSGSYNAIEIYSMDSIEAGKAVNIFTNYTVEGHTLLINDLHQDETGRFYGIGRYFDGSTYYSYLIIFNNFIQDGFLKINKYYLINNNLLNNVIKKENSGIYVMSASDQIIKFEINILEGNKTEIANIIDGGVDAGTYYPQINFVGNNLIFTKLWETANYQIQYTKAIINIDEELQNNYTLNPIYTKNLTESTYIQRDNKKYNGVIFYLNNSNNLCFDIVDLNGTVKTYVYDTKTFSNSAAVFLEENYLSIRYDDKIDLCYVDFDNSQITTFYSDTFQYGMALMKILKKYNLTVLFGLTGGTNSTITAIKNIYSKDISGEQYYNNKFFVPYYLNLYADSEDDTSLIFSRNAIARFYTGNQIISTFNVPNYMLNNGQIKMAKVFGQTNYIINEEIQNFEKNKFESLYFNFIYNLNIVDNTNGLNELNPIASNRLANSFWNRYDNQNAKLTKARITYEDNSVEIIEVSESGGTSTFVQFSFNIDVSQKAIVKIEYLSNDEKTVYATVRKTITSGSVVEQTVYCQ